MEMEREDRTENICTWQQMLLFFLLLTTVK